MGDARLVIRNLNKSYAVPVLADVNCDVQRGEIHALVGENGAGKTTLINILTGLTGIDSGDIKLDDVAYQPKRPNDAFAAGVACAAQELSIIDTLSVAENVGLKHLPGRRGIVDRRALDAIARSMLSCVGLDDVEPDTAAGALSLAQRQLLEIARALASDPSLLLLDEPTAALNGVQAAQLHVLLKDRSKAGVSIVYVSHRLDDVLDVADTVSVLRDGRVVAAAPAADFSADDLVRLMAGDTLATHLTVRERSVESAAAIRADRVTSNSLPYPVSFTAHAGEITGLAGLAGAGRSELLHAMFGLTPLTGGTVTKTTGEDTVGIVDAKTAVDAGIALVGEDRQSMGLYNTLSVRANMMLPGGPGQRRLLSTIDDDQEQSATDRLIARLGIDCRGSEQVVAELSGGNQQKALIARWLHVGSEVFLLDEPTRGVDVATKHALYEHFRELAAQGASLVIASSEIEELMAVCDRIIVMSDRRIVDEFAPDTWSEEAILAAAFSAFSGAAAVH